MFYIFSNSALPSSLSVLKREEMCRKYVPNKHMACKRKNRFWLPTRHFLYQTCGFFFSCQPILYTPGNQVCVLQFSSDTDYPVITTDPTGYGLSPMILPPLQMPIAGPRFPPVLRTDGYKSEVPMTPLHALLRYKDFL